MARRALFMLAAVLVIGCSRSEEGVTTMGGEGQIKSQIEDQVTEALTSYQAAMKASDTETAVAAYSDDYSDAQGNDKASRRDYFNGLFAMGIFRDAKFDNESLDIVVDGDIATAAPVTYVTAAGTTTYEYKMRKEAGDTWRILSAKQIPTPSSPAAVASTQPSGPSATMESQAGRDLLGDAGRLVDRHAMVWVRRLNAPIEQVWETISTIDGLNQWWLGPPKAFELRPGGAFNHHWNNTITDFKEYEYIDFNENTSDYASTGGMRFELSKVDDNTTMFMFLDTWGPEMSAAGGVGVDAEQPGGPGTPWSGVAAGWHRMVDKLENVINGREPEHTMEELTLFYVGYLRDMYRWNDMVQRGSIAASH